MEIDTIALIALSSVLIAGSSYVIWAVNCRRRVIREQIPIKEEIPVREESPKDWGIQNPVAHV